MLRIYGISLLVLRGVRHTIERIGRKDSDLARQARKCASSMTLNTGEGSGVYGKNQRLRYATALGSAKELRACIDVAVALGYVDDVDAVTRDPLEHVIATLINLVR